MGVKLIWKGKADDAEGLAVYETAESTYEVWLPTLKTANLIYSVLRDIFAEGRRMGHVEMRQGIINAMHELQTGLAP